VKKTFISFWFLSLISVVTAPLLAGLNDPTELGVQAGYLMIEGDSNLKDAPVYGARFGSYLTDRSSIELSILAGQSDIRGGDRTADLLLPTLEGQYHFGDGQWRPYLAAGGGFLQANRDRRVDKNHIDLAATYGGGVKYYARPYCVVRGDVRHVIDTNSGKGTHNALVTLGVSWLYGGLQQEAPASVYRRKVKKIPAAKPQPVGDSDSDGVADNVDRCPDTPVNTPVNAVGCPKDSDYDGVTDDKDACPDTPYGANVNERGCPAAQDSDKDGVEDSKDDCPNTPAGAKVGADGCPQETKAVPTDHWVLEGVTFEKNADKLTDDKQVALDNAVEILTSHSKIRVQIQGHTDSFGGAELNQKLSERRALSVKTYLVKHGVSAERLETVGYGETKPIAPNTTPEGRAKNRRIEFKVLSK
jgi:OOP family OmpA-OmpF porin